MTIVRCDNCGKLNALGYVYGYDCCPHNEKCIAKLTIRASTERYAYPYSANIPNQEQIIEAKRILKGVE